MLINGILQFSGTTAAPDPLEGSLYYNSATHQLFIALDNTFWTALSPSDDNVLGVHFGGTGQSTYNNGDLLIGTNAGNTLVKAQLTEGVNIAINPGPGSITIGINGQISLSNGGTGSALTANLGSIVYSGNTTLELLAASSISNQLLMSQGNAAPIWSAATYPVTTTQNSVLYSSLDNQVDQIPSSASAVLVTDSSGLPAFSQALPASTLIGTSYIYRTGGSPVATIDGGTGQTFYDNGEILIGNSSTGSLNKTTLTAGTNISIQNNAGAITITGTGTNNTNPFSDNDSLLYNLADNTKLLKFNLSALATSTTRTLGVQNVNGTIYVTGGQDVSVLDGGTGQSTYADGELLIGNSITGGLNKTTLISGNGIVVTNGNGTIEISSVFTGSGVPVSDNVEIVYNLADNTKKMRFDLTNITHNATRILTVQDTDGTIYVTGGQPVAVSDGGTGATSAAIARANLSAASSGANSDITSLSALVTPLSVSQGGTDSNNATDARTNLSAAKSGANSDITSLTGLTGVIKAPSSINDSNNNELLIFSSTTSAVNEITITNKDTTNGPIIAATGDDTNIDLHIDPKGSGSVILGKTTISSGTITGITDLAVADGGTGASDATNARANLSAAKSGANSDITSLTGLSTPLSIAQGGTGLSSTPTSGQLLIGNAAAGYTLNTLTAGSNITITIGDGSIEIAATGGGGSFPVSDTTELVQGSSDGSKRLRFELDTLVTTATTRTMTIPDKNGILIVDNSGVTDIGASRLETNKGADVVAANDLTLGIDGNLFTITGNTQINAITTANWVAGSQITLLFTGTPTLKHNTAGGAGTVPLKLDGSGDFLASNDSLIGLIYDGSFWHEMFRKVP